MIFIWGIIWSLISYWHVHRSLKRERVWWRDNYSTLVVPNLIRRRDSDPIGPCGTGAGVEPPQSGPKFLHGRHRGYSVHAELEVPPAAAALGTERAEEEPEMQEVPASRAVTRDEAATSAARDSTVTVVDAEFVASPGDPTKSVEYDTRRSGELDTDVASRSGRLV